MDALLDLFWPPSAWHWLVLALILLAVEIMLGTFDLLWVSIAAGATALFATFAIIGSHSWQGQLIFFAVASIGLIILGRTVFADMRRERGEHPTLNRLMNRTIGRRATVISAFSGGRGRVRLGDTEWGAESVDGSNPGDGDQVVVEGTEGNGLKVRSGS
jgi:membrane protein implicated in regulation of membrane protease activity